MKGMNLSEGQVQQLLSMAAQKLGTSPQALAQALSQEGTAVNLPPQVAALMQDKGRLQALMQDPTVQQLLERLK